MKKALVGVFVLSFFVFAGIRWEKIIRAGEDGNKVSLLFLPSDMVFGEKDSVYVIDLKGCVLRKYSKEGKLLKETGRKGNGPGEFRAPFSIFLEAKRIYVWDMKLRRISVFDNKLAFINSFRLPFNINDFFIADGKIYASVSSPGELANIFVLNNKGEVIKKVLDVLPHYLKRRDRWLFLNRVRFGFLVVNYNTGLKKAVATFRGYDNGNYLYIFSPGEEKFERVPLNLFRKYRFPDFLLRIPLKYPPESRIFYVEAIHLLDDGKILLNLIEKKREKNRITSNRTFLVILGSDGEIKALRVLTGYWRTYDVKKGTVLMRNFEEEEIFEIWRISSGS